MNPDRMTIGQMAEMNYVSVQTLRLYDKEGLLKPIEVDQATNYRYYHINQSARLDMIIHLQRYGLTLKEIKEQLENHDIEEIKLLLKNSLNKIDEKIEELARRKKAINMSLKNYDKYEALKTEGVIFREFIDERYIYKHRTDHNFFEDEGLSYEMMLREFKANMKESHIPMNYFFNVGTIMRKENLLKNNFLADEVFVFVDPSYLKKEESEVIPSNMYLAICGRDFQREKEYANMLLEEIDKKGYKVNGDYICEIIAEFAVLDDETRDVFYKIQIPIKL